MHGDGATTGPGPNCWQCRFFAVSWDPRLPYACHRLGFKSAALPALEVLRTDGQRCRGFEPKPMPAQPPAPAAARPAPVAVRPTSTRVWTA